MKMKRKNDMKKLRRQQKLAGGSKKKKNQKPTVDFSAIEQLHNADGESKNSNRLLYVQKIKVQICRCLNNLWRFSLTSFVFLKISFFIFLLIIFDAYFRVKVVGQQLYSSPPFPIYACQPNRFNSKHRPGRLAFKQYDLCDLFKAQEQTSGVGPCYFFVFNSWICLQLLFRFCRKTLSEITEIY